MVDMSIEIPGGRAGHTVSPCRGTLLLFSVDVYDVFLFPLFGKVVYTCWPIQFEKRGREDEKKDVLMMNTVLCVFRL